MQELAKCTSLTASFLSDMLAELQSDVCSIATGGFEYSSDHYELTMQALAADGLAAQKIIQAAIDSLDSGKIIEIEN